MVPSSAHRAAAAFFGVEVEVLLLDGDATNVLPGFLPVEARSVGDELVLAVARLGTTERDEDREMTFLHPERGAEGQHENADEYPNPEPEQQHQNLSLEDDTGHFTSQTGASTRSASRLLVTASAASSPSRA